jgi:hypothetical protein
MFPLPRPITALHGGRRTEKAYSLGTPTFQRSSLSHHLGRCYTLLMRVTLLCLTSLLHKYPYNCRACTNVVPDHCYVFPLLNYDLKALLASSLFKQSLRQCSKCKFKVSVYFLKPTQGYVIRKNG